MKKIIILSIFIAPAFCLYAQQDFKTNITTARTSYASGKLEDTHFALQQALQELDIIIGKEVLKILPAKLDTLSAKIKDDHVTGNAGYIGANIHRNYGGTKSAEIDIMSNSPLIGTLNMFLNSSMLGGLMRDENNKIVKVQGYKAKLERQNPGEDIANYRLDIPLSSSIISLTVNNTTVAEILTMANTLPLAQIAKLIQ